jgi:hypothetical protein
MSDTQQDQLFAQKPYVQDLSEYMEDARDAIAERLESNLDSPAKRFIDDVVIPVVTIGTILAGDIFAPAVALATTPALVAATGRLAIPLSRMAQALGITVLYNEIKDAVKKACGGGDKGKDSGLSKSRIQNTPQEARSYIEGLQQAGCLGKWKSYGRYRASKFIKDCAYKGFRFKKGEFISRDRLHHEIELFKDVDTHSGAIEPKGGTQYKGPDPTKKLRG